MKPINWSKEKDDLLIAERGISFKDAARIIEKGEKVIIINNEQAKFSHQKMFIIEIDNYPYVVPYVEDDKEIFLKTMYPCRKWKKLFLEG